MLARRLELLAQVAFSNLRSLGLMSKLLRADGEQHQG
jgi:hypothetical protein